MSFFIGFGEELVKLSSQKPLVSLLRDKYNVEFYGKWIEEELKLLDKILAKLPSKFVAENDNLRGFGRAPVIQNAPKGVPGHSMYKPNHPKFGKYRGVLVIFDKGVYDNGQLDEELFAKSVLHDLAHTYDIEMPKVFGKPPFITGYASKAAKEDFAESFAEYFLHQELLSPAKKQSIKELLK